MKHKIEINENMQKELDKKIKLLGIVFFIVGLIGIIMYITIGTIMETEITILEYLLYVFAFCLVYGILIIFLTNKNLKNAKNLKAENEYEFLEDSFTVSTIKNNEVIATEKVYYKDIFKLKETENYLFVYKNRLSAFPIKKQNNEYYEDIKKLITNLMQTK